jgi:hypothetical protein
MLHKFERYISKNIPSNALAILEKKAVTVPHDYKGLPATGKALDNWVGWQQRQNVEPSKYNLIENKERIGKVIRQHFDETTEGLTHTVVTEQATKRKAILFKGECNHMQSTPYVRRSLWYMQMESTGFYRSHAMLWSRNSDDPWRTWGNRYEIGFTDMNLAVKYARQFGFEVDIVYPHERYHTQKAYADNFNFIKESVSDIEDEEEVVFDIMQKLI